MFGRSGGDEQWRMGDEDFRGLGGNVWFKRRDISGTNILDSL